MSFSKNTDNEKSISDSTIEEMLMSLREDEDGSTREKPPVVNTFRLQMEAERRRNRRQVQIVTIAAWFSVTATLALLSYLAFVMLPELEHVFSPETKRLITQLRHSLASYGGIFAVLGAAVLLGYVFSAVLLIVKKNDIFKSYD